MLIEFVGKFYDNHSLSIVNRNIVLGLHKQGQSVKIIPLDSYDPVYSLNKADVKVLKSLEKVEFDTAADVQIRHTYPPIWEWPVSDNTKVIFIQPWEYPKAPFEWQYKFETFADALIVPSEYCKSVFSRGGLNPKNLFVVPNGYDDTLFNLNPGESVESLGVNADKFNFIYVGNHQWRKGLDILLNAWSTCFNRSDNAKLIIKDNPRIYGQSNILSEIINLQYKTHCAEIIYIDDELSASDMANLYKASDILVHPYRAEGFAMHVQEAAACGCVPIIPEVGPTDDFIPRDKGLRLPVRQVPINIQDPNLFILKPGDSATMMSTHTFINEPSVDHLVRSMRYAYYSHDKELLLANAKVSNLSNTWDNVVNQYIDVINTIGGRSANRI